jgi:hypothetical protein
MSFGTGLGSVTIMKKRFAWGAGILAVVTIGIIIRFA